MRQRPERALGVLTGAGRMFCAGGDVPAFTSGGREPPAVLGRLAGALHSAQALLARMDKPLVVLVNGAAAGAGFGLAMSGDTAIASREASFVAAYGRLGLSPDAGLTWLLPRLVGLRRAQEIVLGGRRLGAEEAQDWGLVTRVVDADDLTATGAAEAARMTAASGAALGATRTLLLESLDSTLASHLEREARTIAALSGGIEAKEGIDAFLQKRKPDFERARQP